MKYLILAGSIRPEGKSHLLAHALADRIVELDSKDEVAFFSLADDIDIDPCIACDYCQLGDGCVIEDTMQDVYGLLDSVDRLIVVSPIYFAGPPAQFKALIDRLQMYFWTDFRNKPKRKAELFAIGDGGDPHGFDPLVGITRSALSVAGFQVGVVHDCVGRTPDELSELAQTWTFGCEGSHS
ncbi:MAG: flavodoxin family protein [Raoultibacter sp.]